MVEAVLFDARDLLVFIIKTVFSLHVRAFTMLTIHAHSNPIEYIMSTIYANQYYHIQKYSSEIIRNVQSLNRTYERGKQLKIAPKKCTGNFIPSNNPEVSEKTRHRKNR